MYFSRQTTKEEQRYHSYELETLAVVNIMKHFRVYLIGIKFKVVTDCSAIRTTLTKRDLIPRIGRWWLSIQEFTFEVQYRPDVKMAHVDVLSRSPICQDIFLDGNQIIATNLVNINHEDWVLTA